MHGMDLGVRNRDYTSQAVVIPRDWLVSTFFCKTDRGGLGRLQDTFKC